MCVHVAARTLKYTTRCSKLINAAGNFYVIRPNGCGKRECFWPLNGLESILRSTLSHTHTDTQTYTYTMAFTDTLVRWIGLGDILKRDKETTGWATNPSRAAPPANFVCCARVCVSVCECSVTSISVMFCILIHPWHARTFFAPFLFYYVHEFLYTHAVHTHTRTHGENCVYVSVSVCAWVRAK